MTQASNINTIAVGNTIQFTPFVHYSNGTTGTLPDSYGNTVTSWYVTNTAVSSINATGLYLATAMGTSQVHFTNSAGIGCSSWGVTNTASPATLQSISISNVPDVNTLIVGNTLIWDAMCVYSDAISEDCTSIDSRGDLASWTSGNTSFASFSSNILTALAPGNSYVTANVGSVISPEYVMTYLPNSPLRFVLSGTGITMTGTQIIISYK